jgi:putative transposase
MGGTNLVYTQYINRKYNRSGRLWQNRFFSTIVDADRYLWAVARYSERNPLRAGLVPKADAYKWSSCRAHIQGDPNKYLSDKRWLEESDRIECQKLLQSENGADVMAIRKATSTGRPLGSANFIERLEEELDRSLTANKLGRPSKQQEKKGLLGLL